MNKPGLLGTINYKGGEKKGLPSLGKECILDPLAQDLLREKEEKNEEPQPRQVCYCRLL